MNMYTIRKYEKKYLKMKMNQEAKTKWNECEKWEVKKVGAREIITHEFILEYRKNH